MTVKELYGWTPTEVHTPQPDGSVVVTRDSPWDDEERELQYGLDELICGQCGQLRSICSDPNVSWYPQRATCYASATTELVKRRVQERHKKNEPGTKRLHPLDGMTVGVSQFDLTPDDDFC